MTTAPVLDTDALGRLGEHLGDTQMLCGFIRRYESLLDRRVDRLQRALDTQDQDDWMDAVLSLKSSSAMAGATALFQLVSELQDYVAQRPPAPLRWPVDECRRTVITRLRHAARETARQLELFLEQITVQPRPA